MRILLAYICVTHGMMSRRFAYRFVGTYRQFPPDVEHQTLVVCNGGPLSEDFKQMFAPLHAEFYPRGNIGWDIAGFLAAAHHPWADVDTIVCLGQSVYFHRAGWLRRLCEAYGKYGPGFYGLFSSYLVRPHLQTTVFACGPEFLRGYPDRVITRRERYQFEHGKQSFCRRIAALGRPTKLVTWDGCWDPADWRKPANILYRGDQTNCLAHCNHTDQYASANFETKERYACGADGLIAAKSPVLTE